MEVYERIKARREELGLSVSDVAKALGVHRSTVYRYENNDIDKMPLDALRPLAKVLQCTPEYLMGWEDRQDAITKEGFIIESCGTGKSLAAIHMLLEMLNKEGKEEAVRRLEELTELKKYRKEE